MLGVRPAVWQETEQICREAQRRSGADARTCLLSFSCGKDSVAAWLALREYFDVIIPMYQFAVPNLRFVEEAIRYYEGFFGVPILRVPNPHRYRKLRNAIFQPPHRLGALEEIDPPVLTYAQIADEIRLLAGAPHAYHATGVRASDSVMRRTVYQKRGAFSDGERIFYPIVTWNLDDMTAAFDASGVQLPVDYRWFGRTFDGIDYRYLSQIERFYPDDFARILGDFPLADLELFRRRMAGMEDTAYRFMGGPKGDD